MVLDMLEVVFPASSSPASAQYYLMLFELTLFLLPLMVRGGPTVDALYRLWFVQWALPAMLCVLIMLFDSSVALMFWAGAPKLEQTRHQRNFYLTLLNLVLMVATTTNLKMRHEHTVYEERLSAAVALLRAAQSEREEEAAHRGELTRDKVGLLPVEARSALERGPLGMADVRIALEIADSGMSQFPVITTQILCGYREGELENWDDYTWIDGYEPTGRVEEIPVGMANGSNVELTNGHEDAMDIDNEAWWDGAEDQDMDMLDGMLDSCLAVGS